MSFRKKRDCINEEVGKVRVEEWVSRSTTIGKSSTIYAAVLIQGDHLQDAIRERREDGSMQKNVSWRKISGSKGIPLGNTSKKSSDSREGMGKVSIYIQNENRDETGHSSVSALGEYILALGVKKKIKKIKNT